jgi:hypothetical protein
MLSIGIGTRSRHAEPDHSKTPAGDLQRRDRGFADSPLSEPDSNPRSPVGKKWFRFGEGEAGKDHGDDKRRSRDGKFLKRDRGFEQQRVNSGSYNSCAEGWSAFELRSRDVKIGSRFARLRLQPPGEPRSMIDGNLPSDHRSPRSGCAWLAASHFEIVIGIPTFSIRPMVVWNRMLRIRKVVRSHTVSFTE